MKSSHFNSQIRHQFSATKRDRPNGRMGTARGDGTARPGGASDAQNAIELEELIAQNLRLDQKIAHNTNSFNDVLVYCKKTIEKQDEQIKRLDDIISRNDAIYEEKLRKERFKAQEEFEELKLNVNRLNNENLLMKTQLSNQDQMELEMKEMVQKLEQMRRELDEKSEKVGKRELKERELVILTTERVRKELEAEFNEEITKIQKELRIQNLAQIEANQQIVKKVQNDLQKKEREKEAIRAEMLKARNDLEVNQRALAQCETEKKRFENIAQRSRQQAEKMLKESKRQLEDIEKTRAREALRQTEIIGILKKDNGGLRLEVQEAKKQLEEISAKYIDEKKQREETVERHSDQNQKLDELRKFLKYVLEERSDNYIDTVMGENRSGVFAKLLLLLQNVPTV